MNPVDISGQRNETPRLESPQPDSPQSSPPAAATPRRKGLGFLTALLAIALVVALAVIVRLAGEREELRGEVASLTGALEEAQASRAEARATLDGVADQLLALHGTLSTLLQEPAPAGAAASETQPEASSPSSVATPEDDPDYWHDRALELTR